MKSDLCGSVCSRERNPSNNNHNTTTTHAHLKLQKFEVKKWPVEQYGSFYDGDSYIVLRTYMEKNKVRRLDLSLAFAFSFIESIRTFCD